MIVFHWIFVQSFDGLVVVRDDVVRDFAVLVGVVVAAADDDDNDDGGGDSGQNLKRRKDVSVDLLLVT